MKRYLIQCDPNWKNYHREMGDNVKAPRSGSPTIFIDLASGHWFGRSNWPDLRRFMKAIEGEAKAGSGGDVWLSRGDGDQVRVQLVNKTGAGLGPMYLERPKVATSFCSSYRYSVDAALLTPIERVCLFADHSVKRGYLNKSLSRELGSLASSNTLLCFAGIFGVLFAVEVAAGAAAAIAVARLFGVYTFVADMKFYNREGAKLRRLARTADNPQAVDEGARVFAGLYAKLVGDIATNLGITKIADFASAIMKRVTLLIRNERAAKVNHIDPPTQKDIADKLLNKKGAAKSYIANNGYTRFDLLEPTANPANLEPAAVRMFRNASKKELEVTLIRDPGTRRRARIDSRVSAVGKPQWMKAKSKHGIDGIICLSMPPKRNLRSLGKVDLSHLKGLSPAMDALIKRSAKRPAYEFPKTEQPIWKKGKDGKAEVDYGSPKTSTGPAMNSTILVEVPVKGPSGAVEMMLLPVTKNGKNPFIGDIDVAAMQRPGTSKAGTHRQRKNKEHGQNPEDDVHLEWKMNQSYTKSGGNSKHQPIMHGGAGASAVHVLEGKRAGRPHWSPRKKDGSYDQELLYVFLPICENGKIVSKCYTLKGWKQAETFFKANYFQWPF